MAETWFNHKTNQVEIRGEVDDTELAEVAIQVGYCNAYCQGVFEVANEIQSSLPAGFRVEVGKIFNEKVPAGSIRVGQVKVRHGDPSFPLYIVRVRRGRPPITGTGEKMIQTAVWLRRDQIEFLKSRGNLSWQVRELIDKEM